LTTTPTDVDASAINNLFEVRARQRPLAVALVARDETVTYRELDQRAQAVACAVTPYCDGPDALIGVHLERSVAYVAACLGVLRAGGAFVPLEPSYPPARLRFMSSHAHLRCIITRDTEAPAWHAGHHLPVASLATPHSSAPFAPSWPTSSDHLAAVFYTSGSTGNPKGVAIPHAGMFSRMPTPPVSVDLSSDDVFLFKSPPGFSSVIREIFWPLSLGARTIVVEPGQEKDPSHLVDLVREHRITVMHLVPTQLREIVSIEGLSACTSLRHVVVGGETLSADVPTRLFAATGAQLHQIYGSTEATTATSHTFDRTDPESAVTIGTRANLNTFVLDDQLREVASGEIGEIYVGGPGLARGYLNAPELTAGKFIESGLNAAGDGRLYRTGDMARVLHSGVLEFAGRTDDQVKIRGNRVELGEVRAALLALAPIRDAEVIAHQEDATEPLHLEAYLVLEDGAAQPSADWLRESLAQLIPAYMIPAASFVVPGFPTSLIGKLDVDALRRSGHSRVSPENAYVAPMNDLEHQLSELWSSALGLENVGVNDSFFAIGGQSLLAMQTVAHIQDTTGHELVIADVFVHPTIAELSKIISAARKSAR
jgi:amino acid adenylation domain-containing protein